MNEEIQVENTSTVSAREKGVTRGKKRRRYGKAKRLRLRKKLLTKLRRARFNISLSKRNVTVCLTDGRGNVLAWCTGGRFGFKGSKRGSAIAARYASRKVVKAAVQRGVREAEIVVRGYGRGRKAAIRGICAFKVRARNGRLVLAIKVRKLVDYTRIPHNGCRLPRRRHIRRRGWRSDRMRKRTILAPFTMRRYWRGKRFYNRYPPKRSFERRKVPYLRKLLV